MWITHPVFVGCRCCYISIYMPQGLLGAHGRWVIILKYIDDTKGLFQYIWNIIRDECTPLEPFHWFCCEFGECCAFKYDSTEQNQKRTTREYNEKENGKKTVFSTLLYCNFFCRSGDGPAIG